MLVVEQAGGHVVVQVGGAGVPSNWHCVSYNILTKQSNVQYSNTLILFLNIDSSSLINKI